LGALFLVALSSLYSILQVMPIGPLISSLYLCSSMEPWFCLGSLQPTPPPPSHPPLSRELGLLWRLPSLISLYLVICPALMFSSCCSHIFIYLYIKQTFHLFYQFSSCL
jgi:hypothetical protein